MKIQLKAYYNLLKASPPTDTPLWQIEDYRELSTSELFGRLENLEIILDKEGFLISAEAQESPENLTDSLSPQKEQKEQLYLIVFELWRRLLPEKPSLSILGDELDFRIDAKGSIENLLILIEEALNTMVDEGMSPKDAFRIFSGYCAHDFESFFYDYTSILIDGGKLSDAAELIDRFYPFLFDTLWFDFLRTRTLIPSEPHETNLILKNILDQLKDHPDLDLLLEMAAFLVHHGDPHLFHQATRQAYKTLSTEEDFQDLLATTADYYQCLDMEKEAKEIQSLFAQRKDKNLEGTLSPSDPIVTLFKTYLRDADWSKV